MYETPLRDRLRINAVRSDASRARLMNDAADRIELLEMQVVEMRATLQAMEAQLREVLR